jgi:hypothetical protein
MPYLRFDPYYALPVYSTIENGSEFPFKEGEAVVMKLQFGTPVVVPEEDRQREVGSKIINIEVEVPLRPKGKEINDGGYYILSEVKRFANESYSYVLRFSYGLENILQAVITTEDTEISFPFEPGQIVTVSLIVERVKKCSPSLSSKNTWQALLVPSGDEVDGLIVTSVELTKE